MAKIKIRRRPPALSLEMTDLERFIKKYKFNEVLSLLALMQTKWKG